MEIFCSKCLKKTLAKNTENKKLLTTNGVQGELFNLCPRENFIYKTQEAQELNKPVMKKCTKRKIVTLGIDNLWAADLLIMTQFSS